MKPVRIFAIAVLLVCISACSNGTAAVPPTPSSTAVRTSAATASPTAPTPTPSLLSSDGELLFTITATATSLQGASVALRQQVFAPVELADLSPDLQEQYKKFCVGWVPDIADYGFVRTVIDVTDTSPAGKSWATAVGEPVFDFSYVVANTGSGPAYVGAWSGLMAACASVFVLPGHTEGTFAVVRTAGSDDAGGWARNLYGFDVYDEPGSAELGFAPPTFTNCAIVLEPAAAKSTIAQKWKPATDAAESCTFGVYERYFP